MRFQITPTQKIDNVAELVLQNQIDGGDHCGVIVELLHNTGACACYWFRNYWGRRTIARLMHLNNSLH